MKEHLLYIAALFGGVIFHIIKKAAQRRLEDKTFSLKDYLLGHPYQTFTMFGTAISVYIGLVGVEELTLSAAFLAGVAANATSDLAKGDR